MVPGPIKSKLREHAYQHYQHNLQHQHSVYVDKYRQLESNYFDTSKQQKLMASPESMVKKLIHALESPHPKAHYYIGLPAQLFAFLHRILPDSIMDWVIRRVR